MSGYRGVFFTIYRYLQTLFVVLLPVQFYLAAAGIFRSLPGEDNSVSDKKIEDNFGPHAGLGSLLTLLSFLLLLIVLVARPGKRFVWGSLGLALLLIVQNVLAWTGEDAPWVAALHGLNALIILAVSGFLARDVWHGHRHRKLASTEAPAA